MKLNILAFMFVLSLVLGTQVVALLLQYRVNRTYKGIKYWLLGSGLMALGFIMMPLVAIKPIESVARLANPILILGHLSLYIGVKLFLNRKTNKWIPILIFVMFNLFYYYYMFIINDIYGRTIVISVCIAIISFMIAYELYFKKDKFVSSTSNFTASVFFVYGCFYTMRTFLTIGTPSIQSYDDQRFILLATVITSIIISNLWSLGLIIMVNQRLDIENQLEKEKLQLIFSTNIDAQLITRLDDGLIVDVNDEFTVLSGYSKGEVIGKLIEDIWDSNEDRNIYLDQLNDNGLSEDLEFVFRRKDDSKFMGITSGKIIEIESVNHIISVVRDITKRKLIECEMNNLVKQLEIEKNTAQLNAITDSLTGLYNRGYFDKTLRMEFSRISESGSMLSLIMLDIDYFKNFNDKYGHIAGDECIQMISNMLKDSVKETGNTAARYGGEEFIIILPDIDEDYAKMFGEKIRKSTEDLCINHEASEASKCVTVSVGIVTVYPSQLKSPDQSLKMTDEALYEAKGRGRNCCAFKSKET